MFKDCENRKLRQQTGFVLLIASAYAIGTVKL